MELEFEQLAGLPRGEVVDLLRRRAAALTLSQRFALLHRLGIYAGAESESGPGSSLAETAALRAALPGVVSRWSVGSVLDLGCGDFHWLRTVALGRAAYVGLDLVPDLVRRNRHRHGGGRRRFAVADVTRDPLPRADLVLCRDLLVHLGLDDVRRVLDGVHRSGSRLFLASHFPGCRHNAEILSGDFRPLDLRLSPFFLPEPVEVVDERSELAPRALALWPVEALGPEASRAAAESSP